jgi:hypothetical protein
MFGLLKQMPLATLGSCIRMEAEIIKNSTQRDTPPIPKSPITKNRNPFALSK